MGKVNGGKEENFRLRDISLRLEVRENVEKTWYEHFEGLYNQDIEERVTTNIYHFDGARRILFLEGKPASNTEIEMRARKFKNGKAAGKDEVAGKKIINEGELEINIGLLKVM